MEDKKALEKKALENQEESILAIDENGNVTQYDKKSPEKKAVVGNEPGEY